MLETEDIEVKRISRIFTAIAWFMVSVVLYIALEGLFSDLDILLNYFILLSFVDMCYTLEQRKKPIIVDYIN